MSFPARPGRTSAAVAFALGLIVIAVWGHAQGVNALQGVNAGPSVGIGPVLPATCNQGDIFSTTGMNATQPTLAVCVTPGAWRGVAWGDVNKNFTNMPNNTFVNVLTITVPNDNVAASIIVDLLGSLGPGGAVGEHESTTARQLLLTVTRVKDHLADAAITVATSAIDARVAGSTTITQGQQFSAWVGTATMPQSITLQYKIAKGGGGSDNHQASIQATISHHLGISIGVS